MIRRYVRGRLHRRLFGWFGASIVVTGATMAVVLAVAGGGGGAWRRDYEGARELLLERFERAWDHPAERADLVASVERNLRVDVELLEPSPALEPPCRRPVLDELVRRSGRPIGRLVMCSGHGRHAWRVAAALMAAGAVLWAASGKIARRISRPLDELARVAGEIGAGKLGSRARLGRNQAGEVGLLADAINDMAARIERQIADQRELLAAVSHEIRTPLSRIRLLVEMGKGKPSDRTLEEVEREVLEIDALVGELLASSRLEFAALSPRELDAVDVARRALSRAGLDESTLEVEGEGESFRADPTLVARALANLLDNAAKHAGGAKTLRVVLGAGRVAFEVHDRGAGLPAGAAARVFEPFYRADRSGARGERYDHASLGLGLALVRRIAEAHGGRAYAEDLAEGGARVGFELPR